MFSLEDYVEPIQKYIDDSLFFELEADRIKKANFFIQKSEATLEDDILQIGQSQNLTFYDVRNIQKYDDNYSNDDGYIVAVYIRSDKMYDSYERKVTDILTLLGDIGGLWGALVGIGIVVVGFITQKIFMSKIVRKIYHIRRYENIEYEAKKRIQKEIQVYDADHDAGDT